MSTAVDPTPSPFETLATADSSNLAASGNEVPDSGPYRYRFTVADIEHLDRLEFFGEDVRFELIDGDIFLMSRILGPHASCITRLTSMTTSRLGLRASFIIQSPVYIGETSQPQPDLAIAHYREDGYPRHPRPEDLLLVIEVMESSGPRDRRLKLPLYARAGIREAWFVDLRGQFIERHRKPSEGVYAERVLLRAGETISPEAFPDLILPVETILRWPE